MSEREIGHPSRRRVLTIATIVIMSLLFVRLYQLQLLYHGEFGKKSQENSVRSVVKDPIRGYIHDRHGSLVVDVGPFYTITLTPIEYDARNTPFLAQLLGLNESLLAERIAKASAYSRFVPTRIKRDLDYESLAAIQENLYLLPGIGFEVEMKRTYPTKARATHLLGYNREITEAQLGRVGDYYRLGNVIGAGGLESSYETILRGQKGFTFFAVNAKGQVLGPFEEGTHDIAAKDGFDLILNVDVGVQAFAESLMTNYRGALVAIDPSNGGILALVSKPDFDPSIFSGVTPADLWTELNSDSTKPLFNRATMTRYPPGSTFKMVLAAAALDEKVITEHTRIQCYGAYRFGDRVFKDMHAHGSVNVVEAIQRSCNVFFYQLIMKVGFDKWTEYGRKFGFGRASGIDIGEETSGLLPSTSYYDRVYGKGRWTQGYLVSLSTGQGEVGVSPLQMAVYAAAIANGGTIHQPHAVQYIRNKRLNRLETVEQRSNPTGISQHTMDLIREGMRRAVHDPRGTGYAARISGIVSAGKTGTAENPHGVDHAWYIGFAPFDDPKIAVAIMLENAGFGGAKAAPIAGLVMERYLYGELKRYVPPLAPRATKPADSTRAITQVRTD
ncbi:MAG: penicillin-binding protein 2 [Ignavibacteria bacterium]|nr:penicillin-binding protein 2 [Ignavibacteria bacterium]